MCWRSASVPCNVGLITVARRDRHEPMPKHLGRRHQFSFGQPGQRDQIRDRRRITAQLDHFDAFANGFGKRREGLVVAILRPAATAAGHRDRSAAAAARRKPRARPRLPSPVPKRTGSSPGAWHPTCPATATPRRRHWSICGRRWNCTLTIRSTLISPQNTRSKCSPIVLIVRTVRASDCTAKISWVLLE